MMTKNLFILLIAMFLSTQVFAEGNAQVFATTGDRTDGGIRIGADTANTTIGITFEGAGNSVDAGIGVSVAGARFNVGAVYYADNVDQKRLVNVAGVPTSGLSRNGEGTGIFAEVKWKFLFLRHTVVDLDREYLAARQISASPPIYARAVLRETERNRYTMVGINFPF